VNDSATGGYLAPTSHALAEDDDLDRILQGLVAGVTGLPGPMVRPRWQPKTNPAPEPNVNWCSIGVIEETASPFGAEQHIGRDDSGDNPDGYSKTRDYVQLRVLASFYGPNARGNAGLLRSGLLVAQNRETLYGTGMALVRAPEGGRMVPEIDNNQTQRRFDIELRFNRVIRRTWAIKDLLEAQGQVKTDRPSSQSFETPSSTNPLLP
jgi:hypothetical protein